jgi:hypothetical protein
LDRYACIHEDRLSRKGRSKARIKERKWEKRGKKKEKMKREKYYFL